MHAPFHVRPAAPRDLPSLEALGPRTFQEAFGALLPEAAIRSRMALVYAPDRLKRDLADPGQAWFVAEAEGGLAGFLALREDPAPVCVPRPDPMELSRLYVAQDWHGRGPGKALLAAGCEAARAKGARSLWLLSWEANARAMAFYRREGFEPCGEQAVDFDGAALRHLVLVRDLARDLA